MRKRHHASMSDETALENGAADATAQFMPVTPSAPQARKTSGTSAPTNLVPTLSPEWLVYFDLKQKLLDTNAEITRLDGKAAATSKDKKKQLIFLTDAINTGLRLRRNIESSALTRSQQSELRDLKEKHTADIRALQKAHDDEIEVVNQGYATDKSRYVHAEQALVEEKRVKVQAKTGLEAEIWRNMKSMPKDAVWSIVDHYVLPELARQTKRVKTSDSEDNV
jgi:hypothetical protein